MYAYDLVSLATHQLLATLTFKAFVLFFLPQSWYSANPEGYVLRFANHQNQTLFNSSEESRGTSVYRAKQHASAYDDVTFPPTNEHATILSP